MLLVALCAAASAQPDRLNVLTINVWSGLDYRGVGKFGEYEPAGRREARYLLLLAQLRRLNLDVILLQEANPAGPYASRLAEDLGYDEIHQVVNAGLHLGCAGIPTNLKEGIAILARKTLRLRPFAARKLSGSAGLHGDILSLHFDEATFALAGKIRAGGIPMLIMNTHLSAAPDEDSRAAARFAELRRSGAVSEDEYASALRAWEGGMERRAGEIRALAEHVREFPGEYPVILGGDFNCPAGSPALDPLREIGFIESASAGAGGEDADLPTWDPARNGNIAFSTRTGDASGMNNQGMELLSSLAAASPRRIDQIWLGPQFDRADILHAGIAVDSASGGLDASDHFGWQTTVRCNERILALPRETDSLPASAAAGFQAFPILSWDTDAGFGYGATTVILNPFGFRESFDLLGYNTTGGERWYRFIFSIPDRELRQGRIYPLALDLTADYDMWIGYKFYGIGNTSRFADEETYTREPLLLSLAFSRGFTTTSVVQAGLRFRLLRNTDFSPASRLQDIPPAANAGSVRCLSLFVSGRLDSRDSFINPSEGTVLQGDLEYIPLPRVDGGAHLRAAGWFQHYAVLFYPKSVFAFRAAFQGLLGGSDLPVQLLLPLGGNQTLRGSVQDRYLDRISALINAELRFPLVWKFGGILGIDAGKVWSRLSKLDLPRWVWNPAAGLRFYWDRIIVRADFGFGKETTGFYLNFGQTF